MQEYTLYMLNAYDPLHPNPYVISSYSIDLDFTDFIMISITKAETYHDAKEHFMNIRAMDGYF